MGPLQMPHHCEMAAPPEEKSHHTDYADTMRNQESPEDTQSPPRASIIFSSSDVSRAVSYTPMAWTTSATTHNVSTNAHDTLTRTAVVLPKRQKKNPQPIPDNRKDDAYWEKRKKNNESAKRSRVLRRMKEQQTAMRVAYLEQENMQLKAEVDLLRNELDKMRHLLIPKVSYPDTRK